MHVFGDLEIVARKLNTNLVQGRVEEPHLFVDEFDVHPGVIGSALYVLGKFGPAHHKQFLEHLVMRFEVAVAVVDEVDHPIQGLLDAVHALLLDALYDFGIHVLDDDVEILGMEMLPSRIKMEPPQFQMFCAGGNLARRPLW